VQDKRTASFAAFVENFQLDMRMARRRDASYHDLCTFSYNGLVYGWLTIGGFERDFSPSAFASDIRQFSDRI